MKKILTVTDINIIKEIINKVEYGTLALCADNKPYSIPLNFVEFNGGIYFHGSKKGKKIDYIKQNSNASFSIVEPISLLPSYFSNDKGNACPATQLFKSVVIDGVITMIENYDEKANALQALMEKLQKEGEHIPLNDKMYEKAINATALFKLIPKQTTCKCSLGQNFNQERYERVCENLSKRGTKNDIITLGLIKDFHNKK